MCTMRLHWLQTSALLMSMTAPNQRGAAYALFHCEWVGFAFNSCALFLPSATRLA